MANLMAISIRTMGPERYTADQVRVWAAAADEERFPPLVQDAFTLVAEKGLDMVAFGALTATGHLTALYVHPQHGRQGIGSQILLELLHHAKREGIPHVHTEASEFSRGMFSRAGFRIEAPETVERDGVSIQRHRMFLALHEGDTR
jgi:putative acetyltransferase